MAYSLTRSDLQRMRLRNQRLLTRDDTVAESLVAALVAVQAQEQPSALLAIRARATGTTKAALTELLEQKRRLLRTWCLRGTLHLVASDDVHWLLPLVAPRLLKNSGRRYRQLELDEKTLTRATELIVGALSERGPLTRADLAAFLEEHDISAEGQRMPHLLRRAALLRLLCLGPEQDGKETYVLLDKWIDRPEVQEGGWKTLADRYLTAYGPASVDDFARWSGARKGEARKAFASLEDTLVEAEVNDQTLWLLATQAERLLDDTPLPEPPARLLPAYDPLLLGYQSRDWLVAPEYAKQIHPGGGFLRPTLIAGGEAAGTWKVERSNGRLEIVVTPFTALNPKQTRLLEDEVNALSGFYEMEATVSIMPEE